MLTLGEAARASKVTKSAISKAIKNGRLSAAKDELRRYQIDPAELFRVFPVDASNGSQAVDGEQQETGKEPSLLQAIVEHLRELLRQVEGERDDLRRRLDQEAEERRAVAAENRRLTLMLTHSTTAPDLALVKRSPWAVLAALLALAGGMAGGVYLMSQYGLLPLR